MVSASDFQISIGRSEGQCFEDLHCCVVSLDKKLRSTLSLFAQVYTLDCKNVDT